MRIRHLSIKNFRGIRKLNWTVPESSLICLIGRGDSTKSTVLEAIRYALFPAWNLSIDAFDFFDGKTDEPIEIMITLGSLPDAFLSDAKYGRWLRGWDRASQSILDEPGDGLEDVISVQLRVESTFEPKWNVVCDRNPNGVPFTLGDRVSTRTTFIGAYADRHLTWAKNSALSRLTESENISASLAIAAGAAKDALDSKRATDLISFDSAAKAVEGIAQQYGVPVSQVGAYRANLDTTSVNIQMGGLSLHDGDMPLRTLGLGSRRMLTMGMEQHNLNEPHVTLIDEVEFGFEPHRIARLLKNLEADDQGEYFLTTHSPVVLRELTVDRLFVVQSMNGETRIVAAAQPGLADVIQGKIRSGAEAFLAANIIVCEGATEVGIGRGLEAHWIDSGSNSFAFTGTALFNANGGSEVRGAAEAFHKLGYRAAVIVDSDSDGNFSGDDEQELADLGLCVIRWDGGVSIEEYFFLHLPWADVIRSVCLAQELHGDGVIDQVKNYFDEISNDIKAWQDSSELRKAIGKAALGNAKGQNAWFKRMSWAEDWICRIGDALDKDNSPLAKEIARLKQWVSGA